MKPRAFLILLLTLCLPAPSRGQDERVGDINGDGLLTLTDLQLLLSFINGRDTVDLYNGHDCVDLGLPSGRLWATMNVGADSPSSPGGYFAWGETQEKETYTWDNYRWSEGDSLLTRYCCDTLMGTVDSLAVLLLTDDAARQQMGGRWRMPMLSEVVELYQRCTWASETLDGQAGFRVTGPSGASLFLPLAGYREDDYYANEGTEAFLWTRELNYATDDEAYGLLLLSYYRWWAIRYRYTGHSVRGCAPSLLQVYDINADGHISIADVSALISLLLSNP